MANNFDPAITFSVHLFKSKSEGLLFYFNLNATVMGISNIQGS